MGFQIDNGHIFRPNDPLFWLHLNDGGILYFFYSGGSIAGQAYDAYGKPIDELGVFATGVQEIGSSFVSILDNGNYLISYRDYTPIPKSDIYSITQHYNTYDPSGSLISSDADQYNGYPGDLSIGGLFKLSGGEGIEIYRTDSLLSHVVFLNMFDGDGDRILSSHHLQSDRQSTYVSSTPYMAELASGGFALAMDALTNELNERNVSDHFLEIQLFDVGGNKLDSTLFLSVDNRSSIYGIEDFSINTQGNYVLLVSYQSYGFPAGQMQYVFDQSGNCISKFDIAQPDPDAPDHGELGSSQIYQLSDGGWIVAWADGHVGWEDFGGLDGIYLQRFDADGKAVGEITTVDHSPKGFGATIFPGLTITTLTSGGFLMTWYASNPESDFGFLPMQRAFDAEGNPVTKAAPISAIDFVSEMMSIDALADGGWRVNFSNGDFKEYHINDLDTAPVAYNYNGYVAEDHVEFLLLRNFLYTDVDGDTATNVIISTLPDKGFLTFRGAQVHEGQSILVSNLSKLHYRPDQNETGKNYTDIGYKIVTDGVNAVSNEALLHINVYALNDMPKSENFNVVLKEDTEYQFSLRQFKFHDAEQGHLHNLLITDAPHHGALFLGRTRLTGADWLSPDNVAKLRYVPLDDFYGADRIRFRVVDDEGGQSRGSQYVHIDVKEVTDRIVGTNNIDTLEGKAGTNIMYGRGGNDKFLSGAGNDIYVGGSGHDTFFLRRNSGIDTVRDFKPGGDFIDLPNIRGRNNYDQLVHDHFEEKNGDLWIYANIDHEGGALVLKHTTLDDFVKTDLLL